jgi:hypothetical protein
MIPAAVETRAVDDSCLVPFARARSLGVDFVVSNCFDFDGSCRVFVVIELSVACSELYCVCKVFYCLV